MLKFGVLLIAALPSVLGSIIVGSTTTSIVKCSTKMASTSIKSVPSSTKTKTVTLLPYLLTSVSTPIVTQTPSPTTSTSTITSLSTTTITASTITDTFSTTSSVFTTITTTTTTTYTEVDTASTTTTSVVFSNIPTSSGFLPIESTVNTPRSKLKKRGAGHPHGALEARGQSSQQGCAAARYAAAVSCIDFVEVRSKVTIVLTATTSTTTLAPSTITASTTTVVPTTSTIVPSDVSTTLSYSTTISVTVTSIASTTSTSTTTTTLTVTSTSTAYDACATNNLLGPTYMGDTIDNAFSANADRFTSAAGTTAYDCCVSCLTSGTCAGSAFETGSQRCYQMTAATCAHGQVFGGSFDYEPVGSGTGLSLVMSNSNCGYVDSMGVGA